MKGYFLLMLVLGMLFTGTVNTILNKLQDLTCVENCDDPDPKKRRYFEQPVWQTLNMFVGEAICLLVYYIGVFIENRRGNSLGVGYHPIAVHPDDPDFIDPPATSRSVVSSSDAIDRTSSIPDTVLAAAAAPLEPLTGAKNLLLWLPTLCDMTATTLMNVFLGVGIVGLSSIVESGEGKLGKGEGSGLQVEDPELPVGEPVRSSFVGVLMVVLAQTFTALQFVIEEKIMARYELPAIKAVGLEGLFGLISVAIGMPIMYLAAGKNQGNFFDIPVGWHQMISHEQILWAGIGIIFSIAFFNWFGLSVTRNISATSRSTIDTCRTLFIWMISLALGWENFKWLQVVGFLVLIYGTFLFNDVISPPPFQMCQKPVEAEGEDFVEPS
ncbi:hypothetical protein HK104_006285 [Borealophlyctis nickersoniae]|nr:hypothetical protein HK104_006285 [Borealophlyctis nickersoniae]